MPSRVPRVTKTRAVVLKHRRFGEADRVITVLTPGRGKIEALAKGLLRPRSKLAGHLEPLVHVELVLAHGRNLDIVTQAQTIEGFAVLRDDLDSLSQALYLLELADRLTYEHAEAGDLYGLLLASLLRLSRGDGAQLVTRTFELALLESTGFRPEWRRCVSCGEDLRPERLAWSALAGGVLCHDCRATHAEAEPIDLNVLKVLRLYQEASYEDAARVRLTPQLAAGLEGVMHQLMHAVAERDLGSARFVAAVRRSARPPDEHPDLSPDASPDEVETYTEESIARE